MMTKQQETDLIQKTINSLPDSYLRSILISEYDAIEGAISDDFGFIDLAGTMAQVIEGRQELIDLQKRKTALEQDLRAAAERYNQIVREFTSIERTVSQLNGDAQICKKVFTLI